MDGLHWFEEPKQEEEEKPSIAMTLGTVQHPANISNLAGVEIMVRDLNRIVQQHKAFKLQVLYGLYYG